MAELCCGRVDALLKKWVGVLFLWTPTWKFEWVWELERWQNDLWTGGLTPKKMSQGFNLWTPSWKFEWVRELDRCHKWLLVPWTANQRSGFWYCSLCCSDGNSCGRRPKKIEKFFKMGIWDLLLLHPVSASLSNLACAWYILWYLTFLLGFSPSQT